ncbi:MAG TPA: TetR/AcrR family transcriptional regulator [Nitrospiria bacterium]|nr:TetR/AcrR family transcriptional regulator [Nitrospiria bacterium]
MVKESSKEKLIRAALQLMLSRGYAGTTVDEICEAAGVSKGSFYHSFKTKEDIGLAALESFHRDAFARSGTGKFNEIQDPIQRAFGFMDHLETVAKDIWGDGCLLGNFAMDLADTHPLIREKVSALLKKSTRNIAGFFEPIAKLPRNKKGPSAEELAEHFVSVVEGAIILGKAHNDWKQIPGGIRKFRHYLELLAA